MVRVIQHPIIADHLTRMRSKDCPSPEFRQRMRRIASLMAPYVTEDFPTNTIECHTPLEITAGSRISRHTTLVPILRAGLAFLDGFLDMIPDASVAHIGLARNEETLMPEPYYLKHPPNLAEYEIIILDPMLATGGSAVEAVRTMTHAGAQHIRFACLLAAPEGIATLREAYPRLPIYTAAIDRCLNPRGYILPGLGDAGDRIFGTCD